MRCGPVSLCARSGALAAGTAESLPDVSEDLVAAQATGVSGLAARYSTALFELADEERSLDEVAADLRNLRALLDESAELRRLILSPVLSREDQAKALDAVLEQARLSDLTRRFAALVALNRRLFALPAMIDGFLAELARRRGEVTANVTVAAPLAEEQTEALVQQLRRAVGAKVSVEVEVDPTLLGGMIVRVGSRMIDSSLRTKLDRLEIAMKGVG